MSEPCIKGTLFQAVAEELQALRGAGHLTDATIAEHLKSDEVDVVFGGIAISTWYPVETYGRMLALLAKLREPGREPDFLVESGRGSAKRVADLGIYSQLDERTEDWADQIGRILVTLSGSFFNFGVWRWRGLQGDGFTIEVTDAADYPDEVLLRTEGFVEYLAERAAGGAVLFEAERSADRATIAFKATRVG